jgi:glycosyltransferase involved in cell wall biosynthesis
MKIAIVGPFFLPQLYGIEKVMWNHARHLARRGHEVHVITSRHRFPHGKFDNIPTTEIFDGFKIHRIRVLLRSPSRFFYYLSNSGVLLDGLSASLEELRPDIVHVHNVASPAWAYIAARHTRRFKKKLFYSLHYHPDCLHFSRWHTSIVHGLNQLPLRTAARLFHLTSLDHDLFAQEYPKTHHGQFAVLPNGVDPPSTQVLSKPRGKMLNILFVGRVEDHRKGFDVLEKAFARAKLPEWTMTVVGRISDEKRHALEAEFGAAVRVLGAIDEPSLEHEYAAADIFVMPSRYEGFGMPYIEAMRYGIPVVGTRTGGIPETVPPGTGLLIPPDDDVALAAAIKNLAESVETREALGEAGRHWSERFHWERIVDQLESHYLRD